MPIDMILLPAPVTAYQELSFFFYPLSISLSLSLFLLQSPIFCYLYTKPSRVVAIRQRRWWRQCRQQKISNKSFRNPASLLSASPDFHYSLLCHLRTLPKLFLPSCVSLSSCQGRKLLYRFYLFSLVAFSRLALPHIFVIFFSFTIPFPRFSLHFCQPAPSFISSFLCIFPLVFSSSLSRNLSSGQRDALANRVCFVCFSCMNLNIATSSPFIRAVITISGAAGCDWKRGSSEFRNYVRHSRERQPELVVMPSGETRQRDLLKQREQRDFLSYLSSFFF